MAAVKSSHKRIKEELIRRFTDLPLESRLPSDRALAAEFKVAFLTINRVMRELEMEGYIERRQRRGTFLRARERTVFKNALDGSVAGGTVIYACPNYFSYHYWSRLHHFEELLHKSGRMLLEYKLSNGGGYENLIEFLKKRDDAQGLVLTPIPGTVNHKIIKELDSLNIPVAMLEPNDGSTISSNITVISPDWLKAGYLKASTLLKAGHRKITYIGNEPASPERQVKIRGMRQALQEYGLPNKAIKVIEQDTPPFSDPRQDSYNISFAEIKRGTTGLIFDSFSGAKTAFLAARRLGVDAPEGVSVIASGNDNGEDAYTIPPLTSVAYNISREMELALEAVTESDQNSERSRIVDVFLVERESVAPPA